jgi:cytochrome c-type biogenesis protein
LLLLNINPFKRLPQVQVPVLSHPFVKLNIFFWFGIGFGIPLLLLSFFSGAAQRWITRQFAIWARLINIVSGVLLLGVGVYDLNVNWPLIQIYLN